MLFRSRIYRNSTTQSSSLTGTSIGQFVVEATGTLSSTVSINSSNHIRPVITLKGSLTLVSGDGSVTSPYVVSTN